MAKATKKTAGYSPVRTGVDPRKTPNGNTSTYDWVKVGPNESIDVVCLVEVDDIITTEQCAIWLDSGGSPVWVYTGPEDPMHDLDDVKKTYRAYMPVVQDGQVKVWPMGKMAHSQVLDISDAGGEITGMVLRIKRTGAGLGTRYSIVPTGKRIDVSKYDEVDVVAQLGPLTAEGVRELIATKLGVDSYDEVLLQYRGKPIAAPTKKASAKTKKKAAPVVEEDDDEDDLLLDDDEEDDDE